jgi:hypothetical protein
MNRRAIAILGAIFLLIVGTLGFLLYQRQHNNKLAEEQNQQPPVQTPTNQTPEPEPEPADTAKAVKLSDDEVISPVLFFQGNGITYFNSQGQLFQTDLQNSSGSVLLSNKRELTIALKLGITKILWPQSGNNFIAEFGTGTSRHWSFYDSSKGIYTDLPSGIVSLAWLPTSDKILLVYVDPIGKATLNKANPDGSGYEIIAEMYEGDDEISVSPDGKSILFWRTQNREAKNIISFLSPDGKVYKEIVSDGYNLGVKWSPDNRRFVFGRRDPQTQKYQLWMGDLNSSAVKNLNVNTVPEKVVWMQSGNYLFAGVPTSGSAGSGLTEDTIMKINAVSGDKTEYAPGVTVDAQNLFLDNTEKTLFFKNAQDRALYYMDVSG